MADVLFGDELVLAPRRDQDVNGWPNPDSNLPFRQLCPAGVVGHTWAMNRVGVLRCLAAAVLFGASAPAASLLAGNMPTLVLAGLLYIGAAAAVTPFALAHRPSRAALKAAGLPLPTAVVVGGALGPHCWLPAWLGRRPRRPR